MNRRKKLPNWEPLWCDLVQEEMKRNIRDGSSSKVEDEENFAFIGKGKKHKGKKNKKKSRVQPRGKEEKKFLNKMLQLS